MKNKKQQSQYKVANSKPTLMVLKVMIILIFFESMFAGQGGRARTANYKGQDFNAELHLELKEVYNTHNEQQLMVKYSTYC
jgi:DnaJ-class molecular chaperone